MPEIISTKSLFSIFKLLLIFFISTSLIALTILPVTSSLNFKYDNPNNKTLLDIGCGCGPIGIYASKLGFTVDMSDINKRAIHLAKKGLSEQSLKVNVFESDTYENIHEKYDYIVSNPPIRIGKQKLYEIVMNAKEHLKENGEVWLVVRKDKGADSMVRDMKENYKQVKVVEKKKGFWIIRACR